MDKHFAQQLLNKVRDDYNTIAQDFSRTRQNPWLEIEFLFAENIEKNDKVLDLGCGNGRYVDFIKKNKGQYYGLDNSEQLIKIAKQKYPQEDFQVGDALGLPFEDNFFDKIYSIAVLHHIPSKEFRLEFLQESKRVLKNGGIFVLTVWKPKDKQERGLGLVFFLKKIFGLSKLDFRDVVEPWFGNNEGERYFHCFVKVELIRLLQQAGFEILKSGVIKNEKGNRQNLYFVLKKL
ncbi:MAG: methyltransferase domain-containing protein [Candidatus Pacebacteria bacterium]|nr:methyltransferase domain-containing protein [Candidatus Paceibacterota bacterium]